MTPAQSYRAAIKAIDDHCRQSFAGHTFNALSTEQQDQVLTGLEKLERIAAEVQEAEGWKWVSAHIDWPHTACAALIPHELEFTGHCRPLCRVGGKSGSITKKAGLRIGWRDEIGNEEVY